MMVSILWNAGVYMEDNLFLKNRIENGISDKRSVLKLYHITKKTITPLADGGFHVVGKAADRFNYVHHPEIVICKDCSTIDSFRCDCRCAAGMFCDHCAALAEDCNSIVDLTCGAQNTIPDSQGVAEPICYEEEQEIPNKAMQTEFFDEFPSDDEEWDECSDESSGVVDEPRSIEVLFGSDMDSETPVYWHPNDTRELLHMNMGIIGTMGSGKTQFTKSLITQLYLKQNDNFDGSRIGILIFDYKGDYNESKPDFVKATNARIIKPYRIPYNPLALNRTKSFLPLLPNHTANVFADTLAKSYQLGHKQRQLLLDCILEAYCERGINAEKPETWNRMPPTFEQVYRIYEKKSSGKTPDLLTTVMKQLQQFRIFEPEPARTCALSQMLNGVVVMDLSGYDEEIQHLVVAITLDQFYAQMHASGSSKADTNYRQIRNFIFVDEADHFMSCEFPSFRKILKEGREFGVGMILSTQSLKHFAGKQDDYSRYILTWVVHHVDDLHQREVERMLNLSSKGPESEQVSGIVKSLEKHESVVKIYKNLFHIRDRAFWELYQEINHR